VLASQGTWLWRSGTQGTSGAAAAKGRMNFSIHGGATASSGGDGRRAARGVCDVRGPSDCPAQHGGAKRHPGLWAWSWHGLARDSEVRLSSARAIACPFGRTCAQALLALMVRECPERASSPRCCSVHAVRRWICWSLARRLVSRPNVRAKLLAEADGAWPRKA
jgi:hypothetical protein